MPVYALGELVPSIHPQAYVHPEAVIIGAVTIGALSSVWPCAVLRGDGGGIVVGERTSIQDGSVVHTTEEAPTTIGSNCVIGHLVHLEGCIVEDECLIGVGAILLHRVVVRTGSVVAANSVLLNDMEVPSGALAAGSPAVIKEGRARREAITEGVESYLARIPLFRDGLRRIG